MAMNPTLPSTLYAGTASGGVFKSTDSGGNWTAANTGLTNLNVYTMAVTAGTLYTGTYGGGIFKSIDSAGTWTTANTGLTNLSVYAMAINPSNPGTLYTATFGGGMFKSINSGATWAAVNTGLMELSDMALAVNPTNSGTIYVATTNGVFKSADAAGTWRGTGLPLDITSLVINPSTPSTLYAAASSEDGAFLDSGGVFKSTDSGQSWAAVDTGLANLDVRALALNPVTPSTLYAGTRAGLFRSINSGSSWTNATNSGFTMIVDALAVNPLTPSTLYAGMRGYGNDGMFRSTDSGGTWSDANSGLVSQVVNAIKINPAAPSTLYAAMAYWGIFKSVNSGGSWSALTNGLPPDFANCPYSSYMCPNFFSLAINPSTPSTVYSGIYGGFTYTGPWFASGVYKSLDSGGSWGVANTGLGNRTAYSIAINPAAPATLYAGTGSSGVFKSTDSGGNWSAVSPGLPTLPVNALALDQTGATTLYAGLSYGGVWQFTAGSLVLPPTNVVATATTSTSINLTWTAAVGAASYRVYRTSDRVTYTLVGSPTSAPFTDTTAVANTAYLYKVRSYSGSESGDSNVDLATAIVFTDPTLVTGTTNVKLAHFSELLVAANAVRALAGLGSAGFTAPTPATGITIRRQHLLDLRSAIDATRSPLGLTALAYSQPTITAGSTTVKAADIMELRNGVL
jgi:photosystem II stability/assembly factor-like uncharacterized protein